MVEQGCPAHWNFQLPPSLCKPECPSELFLLLSFRIINCEEKLSTQEVKCPVKAKPPSLDHAFSGCLLDIMQSGP